MNKWTLFFAVIASFGAVNASWYWPFGSDDDSDGPRLSELMEPASLLIDDATDLASDGKYHDAVAKYREALQELAKVEMDYPERAKTTEFASLRNKRAYVNAAIDTLLLAEARENARPVSITDTSELEKKFLRKKGKLPPDEPKAMTNAAPAEASSESELPRKQLLRQIGESIGSGRFDDAKRDIGALLKTNPSDVSALNLRAVCEASQGDFEAAEATLDTVLELAPRDYHGFYNMANLKLQTGSQKIIARYYYETGRAVGGPKNAALEEAVRE